MDEWKEPFVVFPGVSIIFLSEMHICKEKNRCCLNITWLLWFLQVKIIHNPAVPDSQHLYGPMIIKINCPVGRLSWQKIFHPSSRDCGAWSRRPSTMKKENIITLFFNKHILLLLYKKIQPHLNSPSKFRCGTQTYFQVAKTFRSSSISLLLTNSTNIFQMLAI